jgi:Short C-terminal domain
MIGRRSAVGRRGGLFGTAARTAVVAGTATAVSSRMAHRHKQRVEQDEAGQQMQQAAAPADVPAGTAPAEGAGTGTGILDQLERLAALRTQGVLTDEEFAAAKQRLLAQ